MLVDDARLVVLNAMDAAEKGGTVLTRTACESAVRGHDGWQAVLRTAAGTAISVKARGIVNATGPWVTEFLRGAAGEKPAKNLRLIKGSHIVVKRLFEHPYAYILQNHGVICFGHNLERAAHNVEILEKCALAYLLALCTERKVTKIPLVVREIAFAKLRGDQKQAARGELAVGGE